MATTITAQTTESNSASDIQVILTLHRAGFRVEPLRCYAAGQRAVVWTATSTFLNPVYAASPRDLLSGCKRAVTGSLAKRVARRRASR